MVTPIKRSELATLLPFLVDAPEREWCELSASGDPSQLVYADTGMLSRCREIADSIRESNESNHQESKDDADIQGQSGPELAPDVEPRRGKEKPGTDRAGFT